MKQLLPKLTECLKDYHPYASRIPVDPFSSISPKIQDNDDSIISHQYLWPRVGQFLEPEDVIVTETGTANFGILDVPLPHGVKLISQILWGSIGWSVGATLGAAFAARDVGKKRVILFVGEGSLCVSRPLPRKLLTLP